MATTTNLYPVLLLISSLFLLKTDGCDLSELTLENGAYSSQDGGAMVDNGHFVSACCNNGFMRMGPEKVQCLSTGQFSGNRPTCEDIDECFLGSLIAQTTAQESFSVRSSFMSSYDDVEEDFGPPEHPLQGMPDQVTCQERSLLPPNSELCHSLAYCTNTKGGYICTCYHYLIGNGTHCSEDNIPCERPSSPENGIMRMINDRNAEFLCDDEYTLIGYDTITCRRGEWNHEPPICKDPIRCPDPVDPQNGRITNWGDNKAGQSIYVACNDDYDLVGAATRICQLNGAWSGREPRCKPKKTLGDVAIDIKKNFIDQFTSFTNSSVMRQNSARSANNPSLGLDIVLVYDRSSSLDVTDFELVVNFTKQLISNFGVSYNEGGTRVAAVTFSTTAQVAFNYSAGVDTVEKVFARLDTLKDGLGGGTGMHEGLAMVAIDIEPNMRNTSKHVLFLFTDGQHNTVDPFKVAQDLKERRMEIFTVGVGTNIDEGALTEIASHPAASHFFHIKSFHDLEALTTLVNNSEIDYKPCGEAGNTDGGANHVTNEKAWPWLSIIHRETPTGKKMLCNGVLLCRQWVVTTASCFGNMDDAEVIGEVLTRLADFEEIKVTATLGEYNVSRGEGCEQVLNVDRILHHDDYDYGVPHDNDIALLHLSEPVELNSCARTVCLPMVTDSISETVVVGWSNAAGIPESVRDVPRQFSLDRADLEDCDDIQSSGPGIGARTWCAGQSREPNERCLGDRVGSPLVYKSFGDDKWTLLGIGTKGETCSGPYRYGIFTKVIPSFTPWINNKTANCFNEHIPTY